MDTAGPTHRVTIVLLGLAPGGGGALAAERALHRSRGVLRAYVSPLTEMAFVEFDPALGSPAALVTAIESAGIRAGEMRRL